MVNVVVVILGGGIVMLRVVGLCVGWVGMVGSRVMRLLEWCRWVLNEWRGWVEEVEGCEISCVYLWCCEGCVVSGVIIWLYLWWGWGIEGKGCEWIGLVMVWNVFVVVCCVEYRGEGGEEL